MLKYANIYGFFLTGEDITDFFCYIFWSANVVDKFNYYTHWCWSLRVVNLFYFIERNLQLSITDDLASRTFGVAFNQCVLHLKVKSLSFSRAVMPHV